MDGILAMSGITLLSKGIRGQVGKPSPQEIYTADVV
jgi:hypothetical protein